MCHLLSVPLYAIAVVIALLVYRLVIRAMRLPKVSEDERLQRSVGRVVEIPAGRKFRVEMLGENWSADSSAPLELGDRVRVTGRDGLTLRIEKAQPG